MPKPVKGPRLGSGPSHERAMLANLAGSLFQNESITTTEAKAKRLRPFAERLITFARRGDLHARRQVLTKIQNRDVVHTLFTEIGPRFAGRDGGYTRITKIGPRKGDNAPMAVIELVEAMPADGQADEQRAGEQRAGEQQGSDRQDDQPSDQRDEDQSEEHDSEERGQEAAPRGG